MIFKTIKNALLFGVMPLYFGGASKSTSSNATTNQTTNDITAPDKRNIASDAAIAISGDNNDITKNDVNSTTTNNLTSFLQSATDSNNTTFTDNSVKTTSTNTSSNFNYSTTDFGAVGSALSTVNAFGSKAIDASGSLIDKTFAFLRGQSAANVNQAAQTIDFAAGSAANSAQTTANVLGFANAQIEKGKAAANAPTNKILIFIAAVFVVGLVWKKA